MATNREKGMASHVWRTFADRTLAHQQLFLDGVTVDDYLPVIKKKYVQFYRAVCGEFYIFLYLFAELSSSLARIAFSHERNDGNE